MEFCCSKMHFLMASICCSFCSPRGKKVLSSVVWLYTTSSSGKTVSLSATISSSVSMVKKSDGTPFSGK